MCNEIGRSILYRAHLWVGRASHEDVLVVEGAEPEQVTAGVFLRVAVSAVIVAGVQRLRARLSAVHLTCIATERVIRDLERNIRYGQRW